MQFTTSATVAGQPAAAMSATQLGLDFMDDRLAAYRRERPPATRQVSVKWSVCKVTKANLDAEFRSVLESSEGKTA